VSLPACALSLKKARAHTRDTTRHHDTTSLSIRPVLVPGPGPASPPATAHMLPLCWGADHRVLDGGTLARYSGAVAGLLAEPGRLFGRAVLASV
jgi:hypothetical protein